MLASGIFYKTTYKWWVFSAVALGTLTSVINHGGMSVALPTIAQHFDADLSTAQWVVIAEGLAISALILPMGRLSDIVGRKPVYLSGLVIFAAAAILAAGSQSIMALIAFKALQGFGAAMTQGTGMAMVTSVFPAEERGKGIGSHASVVGTGGVLGPVAGGFLLTAFDWRWLFYVNVLMALIAMLAVLTIIRSQAFRQDTRNRTYDFAGAALSTAVLVTFLLTVSNGSRIGWDFSLDNRWRAEFRVLPRRLHLVGATRSVAYAGPGHVQEPGLQHRHIHKLHVIPGDNLRAVPYAVLSSGRTGIHARAGRHSAAPERDEQDSNGTSQRSPLGPLRLEAVQHHRASSVRRRDCLYSPP